MPYGEYDGPDKADKGKEGGSCNRSLCQDSPAVWYNHGSYAWYCADCKHTLNDEWARVTWAREFAWKQCPQFETRLMLDGRGAEPVHVM